MRELVGHRERLHRLPAPAGAAEGSGRRGVAGHERGPRRSPVLAAAVLAFVLCTATRAETRTPGAPTLRWVTTSPTTAEIRADGITNGGTAGNGAISWDLYFRFPVSVSAPFPAVSITAGPAWTGMSPCTFTTHVSMNQPSAAGATGTRGVLINGFCTTGVPGNPVVGSDVLVAAVTFASCPAGGSGFVIDLDSGDDVFGVAVADVVDRNNDPFLRSDAGLSDGAPMCVPGTPDIAVDPTSLSSLQAVETQVLLPLDISNNGSANLDWTIAEDAARAIHRVVADVPGRQAPLLPHRRSTPPMPPADNAFSPGELTLARAGTSDAGEVVTPERGEVPAATVTLTHSVTRSLVAGSSVSCGSGGAHADNSYLRYFRLEEFGILGGFEVTQVDVGIELALATGGIQPVTVNLYTWDALDPFTFENFVPVGTANALVPDQALGLVTIPVAGSVAAGSTLVVELFTPDGRAANHRLLVGSTAGGETAPSYLAAAACGLAEPVRSGAIGIPEMNLRLDVTGTGSCSGDLPWASVAPAAGVTAPSATSSPTVTLNSAGLVPGGVYSGGLCVQSNDPDSPTVLVPLTLTVDDILFADGFETGNTLLWSVTVP